MDGRSEEWRKKTDGKEKEACCIRKPFIVLHGMVNTKEDASLAAESAAPAAAASTSAQQTAFKTHSVTSVDSGAVATATRASEEREEGGRVLKYTKEQTKKRRKRESFQLKSSFRKSKQVLPTWPRYKEPEKFTTLVSPRYSRLQKSCVIK